MVEHRIVIVDFWVLPSLAYGKKANLTSNDMVYIGSQGISFEDDNELDPYNTQD